MISSFLLLFSSLLLCLWHCDSFIFQFLDTMKIITVGVTKLAEIKFNFEKKILETTDIYKLYILGKSNIMYFNTILIPQWVWFCGGYHSSLQVLIPLFSRWQKRHLLLLFCRPYFSKMENLMADNFWKPKRRLQKRPEKLSWKPCAFLHLN